MVAHATLQNREVYSGSSLLEDWNFQSVSGLCKNFTRMSTSVLKFLINLIGEKISKRTERSGKPCLFNVDNDATFLAKW